MIKISKAEAKRLGLKPEKDKTVKGREPISKDEPVVFAEIEIPFAPQSKHRPRSFVDEKSIASAFKYSQGNVRKFMSMIKTRTVTTKKTRDFENKVAEYARLMMGNKPPLDTACELHITFAIKGQGTDWPVSIKDGDLDNHEKALCDALNGIVYLDDRLIVKKTSKKICTNDEPKIIVTCIQNPTIH